VFSGSPSSPPL